eukprot:12718294-Ditylum_brightwellii.AAC.1
MGEVITNAANVAFDKDVLEWSDDLHARFISKQLDSGRNEICNDTIMHLEGALTQLASEMEAGRRLSSNKNSNSSKAKLSKPQRDMILNMSSKDGISPEEDLVDSLKDFMDQGTVAMAYKHLQERLRGRMVANRNP